MPLIRAAAVPDVAVKTIRDALLGEKLDECLDDTRLASSTLAADELAELIYVAVLPAMNHVQLAAYYQESDRLSFVERQSCYQILASLLSCRSGQRWTNGEIKVGRLGLLLGQTFAVIGMAVAKTSLGLFLLRIAIERWHKIAIWIAMVSLMAVSILTAVIFWVQCIPAKKIYDPLRTPEGSCDVGVTPFAILLGVWCAIADFFFAIFPWIFIWGLNMKYKEKITIAGSMSFGVIAGACGIVRTYEVATGFTQNYTCPMDTVPLIIWSAAEMAVTLMCVGIPILRPLYRRTVHGSNLSSERYYRKQGEGSDGQSYNLGRMPQNSGGKDSNRGFPNADPKLGIRGPGTITRIAGENPSDESILGPEYRQDTTKGGAC